MFIKLSTYDRMNEFASVKSDEAIKHLMYDEYDGGLDVIKDAISQVLSDVPSEFPYILVWNKVFDNVIHGLESKRSLAYILLRNREKFL